MQRQFLEIAASWRALAARLSDHNSTFIPVEPAFIPSDPD
jgi:hypothetical protein